MILNDSIRFLCDLLTLFTYIYVTACIIYRLDGFTWSMFMKMILDLIDHMRFNIWFQMVHVS
jgi:hypothetical protein